MNVDKNKQLLRAVGESAATVVYLVKHGMDGAAFFKLTGLISKVTEIMKDIPLLLPELKDLEEKEAAELGVEAYKAAKMIYDAVKA